MMKRWEYRIETDGSKLNEWGQEGWELVNVVWKMEQEVFYLKRPEMPLRDRITLQQRERALERKDIP
ncbi:hypothetical protein [Paenibacillus marinisediminis]